MLQSLFASALLLSALESPITTRAQVLGKEVLSLGHDARGAASLIRLHRLLDELDDTNLLAEPYTALIYRRNTDPYVRGLAKLFLADVERARGRTTKARELISELGFIQDFHVVGAFDNEGKGGCDTDFGPESALDLKAQYPAKTREVGWRKPHAKSVDGYVDLLTLKPNTEAVGYAVTWLHADAESRVVLSLGVSGAVRLFVNGQKVLSSDRYNVPRVDQHRVQVSLRKGLNRVLIKVCQLTGPLGFYARVERAEGQRPLTVALPDTVPPLERGVAVQPLVLPTLSEVLERRLKLTPGDVGLRADYATVLAWTHAYADTEHAPEMEAERAALLAPKNLELQLLAALLHTDDGNDRRRFLEAALALDPNHPFARLGLGQHELTREHPELALKHAETLLAAHPNFAPAWILQIRALEHLGQKTRAWLATEAAFRTLHVVPTIAREAVGASRRADRIKEAVERTRNVLALRFDDVNARRGLAGMLADLGLVDEAFEQYRKVLALDPFDQSSMLRCAELLSSNGRLDDARSLFALAKKASPDEPEVYEREGRALLHAKEKAAAIASFQQSLVLRPQNPALKEMLRTLRGEDSASTPAEAFALKMLIDAQAQSKTSEQDAVTLAEMTHVRVLPSGLSSRFQQLVVKVFTQRGVEAFRVLPITWSPDRQEVRVLKARITKPDGSVVDSLSEDERNINEPWTGMYYDARARMLSFASLAPGDVLEVQWRIEDTSVENLLSDYWGDVDAVQGRFVKQHYRYLVDMPKNRPLAWNKSTLPQWVKASMAEQGERAVYRFEAENVPRVMSEPNMPGWAESATPLHLSTYQNWEQVGRYYWGLVRDQLIPNEELKRAVDTALKGIDRNDTAKVVAALYGFVVTNTRYVALEFGIHGYKPYKVDRILARRFGDCKDKASLIYAMLKVAGVDSRLVLLRMRHLGALSPEVASLAAFNHAIAYVPKLDLFLDGTAEFHGSHELPSADRIANVLVVEPDGPSRFLTTVEAQPEDNTTSLTQDITLKPDGSASSKGVVVAKGQAAPEMRRQYQTPATRVATFEQQWAQSYPGAKANELQVSDTKALEAPLTAKFSMTMPRFAESGPGMLRFFPFGSGRAFTQALAPLSERTTDLVLPGVWVNALEVNYTLPANWTVPEIPPAVVEESPFGSLHITVEKKDGKLKVAGRLVLSRARITTGEYPAFRAWLLNVDQAFGRKLVAQQGGETASR